MMRGAAICFGALAILATASPANDQANTLAETLTEYMSRAEAFGFSGQVLVSKDRQVLLHRGYGFADPERGIRVGLHMPFYVASVSKPFTAAAILRLETERRLSVTDSIAKYFPAVPESMRGITLHHLLSHTSGIGQPDLERGISRDAFVAAALALPPHFAPGARYEYSNTGYSLLAAIVDRVSGESFPSYLRTHIFVPAGMSDTFVATCGGEDRPAAVVRAQRGGLDQGDAFLSHRKPYGWEECGPTGVVTTAGDLYQWDIALRGTGVLTQEEKRKYETPQMNGYAYGWGVSLTTRGTRLISHVGLIFPEGWNAEFRRYADDGVVVIVLSNVFRRISLSEPVARDLSRIVLGGEVTFPPAPAVARFPRPSADYALPSGGKLLVRSNNGRLSITPEGQDAVNLLEGEPPNSFTEDDARTRRLVEAIQRGALDEVNDLLGDRGDEWKQRLRKTWKELKDRFGSFVSSDVLHTAKMSRDDEEVTTFVRLNFQHVSTVGRYIWQKGKLVGSFDLGSFEGPMQQVEVFPVNIPLVPQSSGGFVAWDFSTPATPIRFDDGALVAGSGERAVTGRRLQP